MIKNIWTGLFLVVILIGISWGFNATQRRVFRVHIHTGDFPLVPIRIRHRALRRISQITQEAIIQGEVGTHLNLAPSFPQRITLGDRENGYPHPQIRVRVRYRIIPSGVIDLGMIPVRELGPIDGPDPMGFAFEIPPDIFELGDFEYSIVAQRFPHGQDIIYPPEGGFVSLQINSEVTDVIGAEGGSVVVPDGNPNDGEAQFSVPAHMFQNATVISLNEVPSESLIVPPLNGFPRPVSVYRLDADSYSNKNVVVTLLYPDFIYPLGPDGILDGTQNNELEASLMGWDGFEWRRLGGKVNPFVNTVTSQVGFFQYYAVLPLGPVHPENYKPAKKVITPNGDGINDEAIFTFDSNEILVVNIIDIHGHRVREIRGSGNLAWDGRDDSSKTVEGGVYIYQYEIDGTHVNGLIAVVK